MKTRSIVVVTLAMSLAVAAPVVASPIVLARATAPNIDSSTTVSGPVGTVEATRTVADAGAHALADYGSLHVDGFARNSLLSESAAMWNDQFTITGPAGVLEFLVGFDITGSIVTSGNFQAYLQGFPNMTQCALPYGANCNAGYVNEPGNPDVNTPHQSFVVQLLAGNTYDLTFTMSLFFQSNVGGDRSGQFDGLFSLTPLSAGADYSTASGHRYNQPGAAAVPEPGSLALLGAGLAMLSRRVRRKRT